MKIARSFFVATSLLALTLLLLRGVFAAPVDSVENNASGNSKTAVSIPNPQARFDDLMAASNGTAKITIDEATGVARFISFPERLTHAQVDTTNVAMRANAFLQSYGVAFGVKDASVELSLAGTQDDAFGFTHVNYTQAHEGVEVFAGELRVHFDKTGSITAVNGAFIPNIKADSTPSLSAAEASLIAVNEVVGQQVASLAIQLDDNHLEAVNTTLYYYHTGIIQGISGDTVLAYEVEVGNGSNIREFVFIDAHSGQIVEQFSGIHDGVGADREISETSLANVVWDESNSDPDPIPGGWAGGSVQQVTDWQNEIDGAKETYNVIDNMVGYSSYDGAEATMRTVNNDPGISCPNANWNGVSTNYCSNVTGDDTVAHEWGHAYTEYTHNLVYAWQPGALNESYSDIWGEVVDLINGRGIDTPDVLRVSNTCSSNVAGANFPGNSTVDTVRWLSGEDDPAFNNIPTGSGNAIRDMWDPTCFGDPGKVSDTEYYCASTDGGGVHTNSGVPNHAFALLVDGGTYNGQTITGIGLDKAAHIYWRSQAVYQGITTDFPDHATAIAQSCTDLVGASITALSATGTPGGAIPAITAADCLELNKVILAVEFNTPPTQCGFEPAFVTAPPLCDGQGNGTAVSISSQDWETGAGSWVVGTHDIANPSSFTNPDWVVRGSLPDGRAGSAMYVEDSINRGACTPSNTVAGALNLDSPIITLTATAVIPRVAIDHYVATETGWDGGNVKISVNGGAWTVVPDSAFEVNGYFPPGAINGGTNDNPLAGEEAFTGGGEGEVATGWGQSQINLIGIASPGDTIQLRFDMGLDGCNGVDGWYVDEVQVYACEAEGLSPEIMVEPMVLESTQTPNETLTHTLTISNTGGSDLVWDIFEDSGILRLPIGVPFMAPTAPVTQEEVTVGDLFLSTSGLSDLVHSAVPMAPDRGDAAVTITHSASQGITALNSVSCNTSDLHADNSYIRKFSLTDFGITNYFAVSSIDIGIETAAAGVGGSQPVTVNLYTWDSTDPFTFANFVQIGTVDTPVADQSLTVLNIPVTGTVPAGSVLVVEFFTPDGQTDSHSLFVGSNAGGQTDPTYLAAADCGITEPTDMASSGFPNMHLVMNVTGEEEAAPVCSSASDIPWVSASPISGTVAGGSADIVDIVFDSTSMATGIYTGTLCLNSNDPVTPLTSFPLTMTVEAVNYGVELSGDAATNGSPGDIVTYTVTVTNTGNVTDTYNIAANGIWITTAPVDITLGAGLVGNFDISVTIPASVSGGDSDVTTVTVTSTIDALATDSADLTTTAVMYYIYLPFVMKP